MTLKPFLSASVAATLLLGACGAPAAEEGPAPHVVAAFYPLEWASTQVLGGLGSVRTLTMPGTEAHDLELSPRQIASLGTADLVFYLAGFQTAVDDAVSQAGVDAAFDAATVVDLRPAATSTHSHEESEHEDEDEHQEEEHVDDGHDHGAFDPHFWQDPQRMATLVTALGAELAEADPPNAEHYRANAAKTVTDLEALDAEFVAGLAQCERTEFITTHAAFGYLASRYGLSEISIAGVNPDDEPSPARIAEIHREAKEHGIDTIFFATLTSDAVATSIASDLGLQTAVLDPLEGVTVNSPGDDYPSIMRANLQALRSANGCL